jgi:hypothetical protein
MKPRLPWIDDYHGETCDELLAKKGKFATGGILFAFERGLYAKNNRDPKTRFTPAEWTVLAVEGLEREVNNGGYHQFFTNSSVEYVPAVVAALKTIGCPRTAALTQEAIDLLGLDEVTANSVEERALDQSEEARYDQLLAALNAIDQRFYAYDTGESIEDSLLSYIEANKDSIHLP